MTRLGPPTILDVSVNDDLVRLADGREFRDVDIALPDDQVEQIRQGYRCLRCLEPQSEPFPTVCETRLPDGVTPACNFPMRSLQAEEFAWKYGGEVTLPDENKLVNEELAAMREALEYEERTGIILPDHLKFPTSGRRGI